jgi:hypothetical protein
MGSGGIVTEQKGSPFFFHFWWGLDASLQRLEQLQVSNFWCELTLGS